LIWRELLKNDQLFLKLKPKEDERHKIKNLDLGNMQNYSALLIASINI
jgi:hypothetical protein